MDLMYDVHSHNLQFVNGVFCIQQLSIKDQRPHFPFSISIHPWYIDNGDCVKDIEPFVSNTNCIAIGETGLDKLYPNMGKQRAVFVEHILLAKKYKKPLIIHCVRAFEECMALLQEHKFTHGVLFHGFNKHENLAKQIIKKGYYISIGSFFLKENPNFERFLIETDFYNILFETDNNSEIEIQDLYSKAKHIHPTLDIVKTITETFNNWKEK